MSNGSKLNDVDLLLHVILINLYKAYKEKKQETDNSENSINQYLDKLINDLDKKLTGKSDQEGGINHTTNNNNLNILDGK